MKRIVFFVEGQTEQLFLTKLLKEISGDKNITILNEKVVKDNRGRRSFKLIYAIKATSNEKYKVLIRDCMRDESVKSDIIDSYEKLKSKYCKIIGLRDVYPTLKDGLDKLKIMLEYDLPNDPIGCKIILAVMEIETWFLAEYSHFKNIDKRLTLDYIEANFNKKLLSDDLEDIYNPSKLLKEIYNSVNKTYNKKKRNCRKTINNLDFEFIYLELRNKLRSLNELISEIDNFLT